METPNQIMARRVKEKFPHVNINPTYPEGYWDEVRDLIKEISDASKSEKEKENNK